MDRYPMRIHFSDFASSFSRFALTMHIFVMLPNTLRCERIDFLQIKISYGVSSCTPLVVHRFMPLWPNRSSACASHSSWRVLPRVFADSFARRLRFVGECVGMRILSECLHLSRVNSWKIKRWGSWWDKEMTMSENIYSMTGVDLLDVNKGDQPFLYM